MKLNKNNPPKVKLDSADLSESGYVASDGRRWSASKLIQYCKEQKYPIFDMPLAGLDLATSPWKDTDCIDDIAWHMKRVMDADLNNPVILHDRGYICDGWHRVVKALIEGKTTIKAIRIERMPTEDGIKKKEED